MCRPQLSIEFPYRYLLSLLYTVDYTLDFRVEYFVPKLQVITFSYTIHGDDNARKGSR